MTPEERTARQERYRAHMAEDFGVQSVGMTRPEAQYQLRNALEYMDFQMGQINRNLARLMEHIEKNGAK